MNQRLRIYVAGPYTKPDPCINTREAILIGNALWNAGFAPFIPHLSHLWHTVTPQPYAMWLHYDLQWLTCCDALFRIPGESSGADKEVAFARDHNIPVFTSIQELCYHFTQRLTEGASSKA